MTITTVVKSDDYEDGTRDSTWTDSTALTESGGLLTWPSAANTRTNDQPITAAVWESANKFAIELTFQDGKGFQSMTVEFPNEGLFVPEGYRWVINELNLSGTPLEIRLQRKGANTATYTALNTFVSSLAAISAGDVWRLEYLHSTKTFQVYLNDVQQGSDYTDPGSAITVSDGDMVINTSSDTWSLQSFAMGTMGSGGGGNNKSYNHFYRKLMT